MAKENDNLTSAIEALTQIPTKKDGEEREFYQGMLEAAIIFRDKKVAKDCWDKMVERGWHSGPFNWTALKKKVVLTY